MPFLEIFDFDATPEVRKTATKLMTKSLCDAYSIAPEIVSAYFFTINEASYSHAGEFGYDAEIKRIFVKVHAFRRSVALRRTAAGSLTDAFVEAYGVPAKSVVIYFFDREPDEVSHAGELADT
ncbi:tautomerase family protein [Pararhizobium sp. LjRoot238]|uniref:tautomerase family protein n=1 Tax=Pararhizobium sp. LjRoot238 TaxID=3342293 RepID=UPI003ECF0E18